MDWKIAIIWGIVNPLASILILVSTEVPGVGVGVGLGLTEGDGIGLLSGSGVGVGDAAGEGEALGFGLGNKKALNGSTLPPLFLISIRRRFSSSSSNSFRTSILTRFSSLPRPLFPPP